MKINNVFVYVFFSLFYLTQSLSAQVQGLSYTLSPYGEYQLFSDKSGVGNGWAVGAQFGFGFGEFVELRADYSKGLGLRTDLDNFGLDVTDLQRINYKKKDVEITRYGGQVNLNLMRGPLSPYITLGTGVQEIALDTFDASKQIYLDGGLGIKFSAANRYTIGLQALNRNYRSNPFSNLMTAEDREDLGVDLATTETGRLSDWSVRGSLILYIGGRRPGELTDVDQAYLDNFSGGFSGLNIPVEFVVSKMDFHKDLPYKDTWMAGGSAGMNFGPLVGVRGFYWRALEDGNETSFDDLALYGGEARFKLNEGKGFTPWLTIGGGNIHVGEGYKSVVDSIEAGNKAFAMGGIGLDLPFSKYVKATAFARNILTTIPSVNSVDIAAPEELKSSWNYGVSLNFILGKNTQKIDVVKQDVFEDYMLASEEERLFATEKLKREYEARIAELEAEIDRAVAEQDAAAVRDLSDEKTKAEKIVNELQQDQAETSKPLTPPTQPSTSVPAPNDMMSNTSVIKMTPAEFQLLLRELLDAVRQQQILIPAPNTIEPKTTPGTGMQLQNNELERINKSIENLAKLQQEFVLEMNKQEMKKQELDKSTMSNPDVNKPEMGNEKEMLRIMERLDKVEANINAVLGSLQNREGNKTDISKQDVQDAIDQAVERDRLRNDIKRLNERLTSFEDRIIEAINKSSENTSQTNSINAPNKEMAPASQSPTMISNADKVQVAYDPAQRDGFFSKLRYKGMSGIAGFGLGDNATFNMGYRIHYQVGSDSSKFELMPETFFGFGSPSAFGILANGVYDLSSLTNSNYINPYIGAGFGFMKIGENGNEDKLVGALNFIVGTSLNVMNGDLFVDFSARNLFKYNQFVVGYRFPF